MSEQSTMQELLDLLEEAQRLVSGADPNSTEWYDYAESFMARAELALAKHKELTK